MSLTPIVESLQTVSRIDGHCTHAERIRIPGTPDNGAVMIIHGMAEHRGRYRALADTLAAHGLTVLLFDLRGHGDSPCDGQMGHFGPKAGWLRQVADFGQLADEHIGPEAPLALLGHSMGSLFARSWLKRSPNRFRAVALSGSPAWNNQVGLARRLAALLSHWQPEAPGHLLNRLGPGSYAHAVPEPLSPFDWLSFDHGNVLRYIADPRCGFPLTNRGFLDLCDLMLDVYRTAGWPYIRNETPILFQSGRHDPCTDPAHHGTENAARHLTRNGFVRVSMRFYPNSRHEVYQDVDKRYAVEDFLQHTLSHK